MSSTAPPRFEGDFVESADLMNSKPVTLTISEVIKPGSEQSKDGRMIDRPIIAFEKATKRFVVSKTNERLLKAMFGPKPAEWVGQQVTLTVRYLKQAFGESNVPTVRVVLPDDVPMPWSCRKHYGQEKPFARTK